MRPKIKLEEVKNKSLPKTTKDIKKALEKSNLQKDSVRINKIKDVILYFFISLFILFVLLLFYYLLGLFYKPIQAISDFNRIEDLLSKCLAFLVGAFVSRYVFHFLK